MDSLAKNGTSEVPQDLQESLLDPFCTAVHTTLAELNRTEVGPMQFWRTASQALSGDLTAAMALKGQNPGTLALCFPEGMAHTLAERMLEDYSREQPDDALVCDCLGEIINVVAGQGKALLHGTAYQYSFTTPRVMSSRQGLETAYQDCLVAVFASDIGEFRLQWHWNG